MSKHLGKSPYSAYYTHDGLTPGPPPEEEPRGTCRLCNPVPDLEPNTALIIIDVQKGFNSPRWGRRNNPKAEANISRLLVAWRESGRPIFHIQHSSLEPQSPLAEGTEGCDFKPEASPQDGEPVIQKHVNSAFIGTDLEKRLRNMRVESVVIVGLTTNHCVETTTRMAGNLGFRTVLVSDATATFDRSGLGGSFFRAEDIQAMTLANIDGEFGSVFNTDSVLAAVAGPVPIDI